MKRLGGILLIVLLLCTFCSWGCSGENGSETNFWDGSCTYCGYTYTSYLDAYAACVYSGEHGVGKCVDNAPCTVEGHYVLAGTTTDKDGGEHGACPYCGVWLCQGAHGIGKCCSKAICGIDGHTMLPGSTKDVNGVDHNACEYCLACLCQGEHGRNKCYEKAPCGLPDHFVLLDKTIDINGIDHGDCEFCRGCLCQGEHGLDLCISADATLKSLIVTRNGQALQLSPAFDGKNRFAYFAGADRTIFAGETLTVTAVANHPAATVVGLGDFKVSGGGNTVTIVVTAQYTKIQQEYTVAFTGKVLVNGNDLYGDPDPRPDF